MFIVKAKSVGDSYGPDIPGGDNLRWIEGQTRLIHEGVISYYRSNPTAWEIVDNDESLVRSAANPVTGGIDFVSGDEKLPLPFQLSVTNNNPTFIGAIHGWWSGAYIVRSSDMYGDVSYIAFGSEDGDFGIIRYDHKTGYYERKSFGGNNVDDHNVPGLAIVRKGRIAIAYSRHADDTHVKFRLITTRAGFDVSTESRIESAGICTYAQLLYKQGRLFLFYRRDLEGAKTWCMRRSENDGATWTDEVSILGNEYAIFADTGDTNTIKFFVYAHPTNGSDHDIYSGSIRTDLGTIRAKSTDVGNAFTGAGCPVAMANLQKAVDVNSATTGTRIYSMQSSGATSFGLLGSEFNLSQSQNMLCRYEYGTSTTALFVKSEICDLGKPFYESSRYYGGACFDPESRDIVYVCRNDGSETPAWEVAKYQIVAGAWQKVGVLYGPVTNIALLARPVPFGDSLLVVSECDSYPTFSSYSGARLRIIPRTV